MPEPTNFLITGRNVDNYRGEPIPAGSEIVECFACKARIVLSPEGSADLAEARASGRFLVASPICSSCVMHVERLAGMSYTETGRRVTATDPLARAIHDALKERMK